MKTCVVPVVLVLAISGCASFEMNPTSQRNAARAPHSEFEDIPVPHGLTYQRERSTIIESAIAKSARLVYHGSVPTEQLRVELRSRLEATGWRQVSAATTAEIGTLQVYEKDGSSLQVILRESSSSTELELIVSRVGRSSQGGAPPIQAQTDK